MQLTKYKLGDLIAQRREKNQNYDVPIRGVSREGFINAKQQEADTSIYNVFYKKDFVFNPARMELNSIALNLEYDKALCSSLYEVFYVKDESIVLPEFLNLHIKREEFARHCEYIGSGSAREYCRFAHISEFNIELPPLNVQEEIVKADRLIKRKIALNNRLIKALEDTAQAIYHHTFVENIDPENLPEGWRKTTIGLNCKTTLGGTPSRDEKNYWGGDIPWINSGEVNELRIIEPTEYITKDGLESSATKLLPIHTVLLAITGATLGQISITEIETCANQSVIGIEHNNEVPYVYVYPLLKHQMKEILRNQTGAAQPHINKNDVDNITLILPTKNEMIEYQSRVKVIFDYISLLCFENKNLKEVNHLLTSKLS